MRKCRILILKVRNPQFRNFLVRIYTIDLNVRNIAAVRTKIADALICCNVNFIKKFNYLRLIIYRLKVMKVAKSSILLLE
jgi:hypothetical protein